MFPSISAVSHDSPHLSLLIILTPLALPFCGRCAAPATMH